MADTPKTWKQLVAPYAMRLAIAVAAALLGALASWLGVPPKVVETIKEVPGPREVAPLDEWGGYAPTQGWFKDDAAIEGNRDEDKTLHFHNTPAGKAVMGDEDALLYRAVRKAGKFAGNAYPNVNQQSVGCCVGCGFKHGCDVVQATAILQGQRADWKPVSVEVIYAGSRVEVGGGRISGDGSVGAWAAKWCKDYGIVPMEKHASADLTAFSPARAREWGRTGVPDALEPLAKTHPIKSVALVTSAKDAKRAIQQGYPIPVCSDQGFRMERDRDGFCAPQGTWYHCMCFIGYRNGARPGFLCLNSWGDAAHTGPVWPADMPPAAFWVDEAVVDRMLRQGDSFALADVQGFPVRRIPLNWDVRAVPKRDPLDVFARRGEGVLAW